jgi:hypothetical protein
MTIDRIWASTTHSPEAMIEASRRGEIIGTELAPWPGVVVILSRERDLATSIAQAIWLGGAEWGHPAEPDGSFRGYSKRVPYSVRVEGHGQRPEFLRDFGAYLHPAEIRRQLQVVRATGLQAFITTMNPAVIDAMASDDAEHARRSFIIADADGARHMGARDAADFVRACCNGIQPIAEFLETQGVW